MEVKFDLLKKCREAATYEDRAQAANGLIGETVSISFVGSTPFVRGKVLEVECLQTIYYLLSVRVDKGGLRYQTIMINPDKHIIKIVKS